MACKGFWECLLRLLTFLLMLVGAAIAGYGIYIFIEYNNAASSGGDVPLPPTSPEIVQLGRPMLLAVSLGDSIFDKLPKAWFIYVFTGFGVLVLFIGCCGFITMALPGRGGCCLSCFSVLVVLLILVELGSAAFMFFDNSWMEKIPTDKTGNFDKICDFLEDHWDIVKWVALGAVILQAIIFLLAIIVRAANKPADYDSDEEYIGGPRHQIRQPLVNRQPVPATGVSAANTLDQRPSRNDAWSTRMREKYGLDTSEFTYNPSESGRYQQAATQPTEEKGGCIVM